MYGQVIEQLAGSTSSIFHLLPMKVSKGNPQSRALYDSSRFRNSRLDKKKMGYGTIQVF